MTVLISAAPNVRALRINNLEPLDMKGDPS